MHRNNQKFYSNDKLNNELKLDFNSSVDTWSKPKKSHLTSSKLLSDNDNTIMKWLDSPLFQQHIHIPDIVEDQLSSARSTSSSLFLSSSSSSIKSESPESFEENDFNKVIKYVSLIYF